MKLGIFCLLLAGVQAVVTEVTDADFADHLAKKIPTIITLYAEWCGHCKTFAPEFDALSNEFAHLDDQIQFLRIDGDKNRRASNAFGLKYFPTVMFVDGDLNEEIDNRDSKSLKNFIMSKTGLTPSSPATSKSEEVKENAGTNEQSSLGRKEPTKQRDTVTESGVSHLIDDNFEDNVLGKHALVAFTTSWCTYCKKMAPEWAKLAEIYSRDDDIVIANIDCTDMTPVQNLVEAFDVGAFPTIVYIPADYSLDEALYNGPRTVEGFVEYLRDEGVSHRFADGKLDDEAGIIRGLDLDDLSNVENILSQVERSESKHKSVYERVLSKFEADESYLKREFERLTKVLKGSLNPTDVDNFTIKRNIVSSLLHALNRKQKTEL